jgi:hypothetical protein
MPYEQSPQPNLEETYNQNHAELLDYLGWLSAALASNYRNERPRSEEHIGKQEETLAMFRSLLGFVRS